MASRNEQTMRAAHAAFTARDIESFLACWAPDCEYQPGLEGAAEGRGEATTFRGHDGVRRWWQQWEQDWTDWKSEIEEIRDLGDTLVVAVKVSMTARATGIRFGASFVQVGQFRDGLCVRSEDHLDRQSGLQVTRGETPG